MCGIVGFNYSDKNLIKKLIKKISHRGPDDYGFIVDDEISLGHARLSIIDLSEKGKQPIRNEDGSIWIVFNGEIYNYKLLREILQYKGHNFYTNTDTEVIIHTYEEYGLESLKYFNGQFVFCIYDQNKKKLIITRDRFGIKPLYYIHYNNIFIFSSEIKAILSCNIKKEINKTALKEYFTFRYTLSPNTLFKNILKLNPGNYLEYNLKTNELLIKNYYKIKIDSSMSQFNKPLTKYLFNLIYNSVKLRMIADVPVGSFLSGGIDSSIITGMASRFNEELNTYSVGFENSSELKYAKIVSDYFNTNHNELIIYDDDVLVNISKMIYHMEEPIGDPGFFPTFLISKLASKYNKVVLAGEGGDEIFGGYDKYKIMLYGKYFSPIIPKFNYKNEIIKRVSNISKFNDKKGYINIIQVFNQGELKEMAIESHLSVNFWLNKGDLYQKMQYFDIHTLMPEDFFMKADKMSSAFGLEERVPYMDHRLVEFAINLPLKLKLNIWNEKFILKKTFSNFLPKEIIKRRKRGYNVPIDHWFKNILHDRLISLLETNKHNYYNKKYVYKLLNQIKRTRDNYKRNFYLAQKLWTIYVFEEWYKGFFNN
ncbi:MAG: asparagine synthase (glutamine-hydrolyzing) [Candidatus Helarchaeota archaeon]